MTYTFAIAVARW